MGIHDSPWIQHAPNHLVWEECGGMCYSLVMRLSQVFSPGKHLNNSAVENE